MFQVIFAVLAVVAVSLHLVISSRSRRSGTAIAGTYLLYLLIIYIGLMRVLAAYAHVFHPIETSASIGWSPNRDRYVRQLMSEDLLSQYRTTGWQASWLLTEIAMGCAWLATWTLKSKRC